jgi:hypothetical protein
VLRLNWQGSDWPKATTPLSKLEVFFGSDMMLKDSKAGFYYRINEKSSEKMYGSQDEAKQAAEDRYFELINAEWHSYHYGSEPLHE